MDPAEPTWTLETLNEELDQVMLRQLDLLQDYTNLTLESERGMREGYFQLARSRYNMGSHSVSKTSLPTEDSERDYKATTTSAASLKGKEDGQVQRELQLSSSKDDSLATIKQFGILTSPSLKSAEKYFVQTLEKTIERLNTASELKSLEAKLTALSASKAALLLRQEPET